MIFKTPSMIRIVSTNIISPLGMDTAENYAAVRRGDSALRVMDGCLGVPGRFCTGIFPPERRKALRMEGFSLFESLVIRSLKEALSRCSVDPKSERTVLVIGTSTAGIEELGASESEDGDYLSPGAAAGKIARALGFTTAPIVVSNACVSGATAQVLASRLIAEGDYDCAAVCGADLLSPFVLAGFSSFKALSPEPCRPFDIERLGLNIGECAATVVLEKCDEKEPDGCWKIIDGCLDSDAYHVSAPDPTGDGVRRTIEKILSPQIRDRLSCVVAHGTATMFNDQMESKAISAAGLGELPLMALKPHWGHTFGASGVVEAIVSMCALDEGVILPVKGFEEMGVSGRISPCTALGPSSGHTFVKVQSGFGSCNGSILYSRENFPSPFSGKGNVPEYETLRRISITESSFSVDGKAITVESGGAALVTEIFKKYLGDGQKFYKMDPYSRLAYLSCCMAAQGPDGPREQDPAQTASSSVNREATVDIAPEETALVLFTREGSLLADRRHLGTFCREGEYYPSPAIFINTLPNVVLGEIALKNRIKGETTLVMLSERDETTIRTVLEATLSFSSPRRLICGWVDCPAEDSFTADVRLLERREICARGKVRGI